MLFSHVCLLTFYSYFNNTHDVTFKTNMCKQEKILVLERNDTLKASKVVTDKDEERKDKKENDYHESL